MARARDTTQAVAAVPPPERGELAIVIWTESGPRVERLPHDAPRILGRAEPADLVVADSTLSRRHARLTARGDYVRVEDLDSKNGLVVDGARAEATDVLPGGQVVAGSVRLVVTRVGHHAPRPDRLITFDGLCERARAEIARARAYGRPLTVALVRAADDDPAALAFRLRDRVRPFDVVAVHDLARVCVLLPELDAAAASQRLAELDASLAVFPDDGVTLDALLRRALDGSRAPDRSPPSDAAGLVVGSGLRSAVELARRFAPSDLPVTILGETGTGKEVLARQIHGWSPRAAEAITVVNYAALPATLLESALFGHERGAFTGADRDKPGLFEQASGGTLFLDEVGELSAQGQAALLRALEDGTVIRVGGAEPIPVDVRVLAATNRDLPEMVEAGDFRLDLWHRLNALVVELPPLRERPDDLPELATRFLAHVGRRTGAALSLSGEALQLLLDYGWPGNVRELQNVLERAALLTDTEQIDPSVLPERMRGGAGGEARPAGAPLRERLAELEESLIVEALDRCRGNQAAAARELGMPRRTLVRRIAQLGLRHRDRWPQDGGD